MRRWGFFVCDVVLIGCIVAFMAACARTRPHPHPTPPPPVGRPTPPPPPRPQPVSEIRAIWISDATKLDWNEATIAIQRAGLNTMYVNFASGGAAFYPGSRVLPDVSTATEAEWRRGIQLAHQRGIAVYAKFIVYFMFKAPAEQQRKMIAANRVMRGHDGKVLLQTGNTWLCPTSPGNRELLHSAVTEMVSRYPVDGLQFDYIRFYEEPSCFCAHCRKAFETSIGKPVRHWPEDAMGGALTERWIAWKQSVINNSVGDLVTAARTARPGLPVTASVFHDLERGRQDRGQDWKYWLDQHWLNYVCTMSYTADAHEFENRIRKQQTWMGDRSRIVAGIGSYKLQNPSDLAAQIDVARKLGAPGFALFSYDDCNARDFWPKLGAPNPTPIHRN